MDPNPFNKAPGQQEKLEIAIEIAAPDEWQECKELRLQSITGPEAHMLGMTPEMVEEEKSKTEQQWREETNSETMFSVLAKVGSKPAGLGRTKKVEANTWRVRNGYVKKEFRGMGIQPKMIALRLNEIIKRGGDKAITGIRTNNPVSIHNAEKCGFKKVGIIKRVMKLGRSALMWHQLEVDLTRPEAIKKINEVLNAR